MSWRTEDQASASYEERVASALARYADLSGRDLSPHLFDREHPEVREAYARFSRPLPAPDLGASYGERLALGAGLKSVLRELVPEARAEALGAELKAAGYSVRAVPVAVREDGTSGAVARHGGGAGSVLLHAGSSLERVARAAELDLFLLGEVSAGDWAVATTELGILLGYPPCCVEAYVAGGSFDHNFVIVAAAAQRSRRFDPLLNNLSLSVYHHIGWYPCRYDCAASLGVARQIADQLRARHPRAWRRVARIAAMPRLYADDRRQLLFAASGADARGAQFRSVHTPYALDRSVADAALEWVCYQDLGAPLAAAGSLRIEGDRVFPGDADEPLPLRLGEDWLWLPFGGR